MKAWEVVKIHKRTGRTSRIILWGGRPRLLKQDKRDVECNGPGSFTYKINRVEIRKIKC